MDSDLIIVSSQIPQTGLSQNRADGKSQNLLKKKYELRNG